MTDEEKAAIVEVLCSQALADHLGDVRDAERRLWSLIGVDRVVYDEYDHSSAWGNCKATLAANNIPLPSYYSPDA